MLSVCDRITDDVLKEDLLEVGPLGSGREASNNRNAYLQDTTRLLIDKTRDTFDTTTTSETTYIRRMWSDSWLNQLKEVGRLTDGGLGDTLDVVAQNFAMAFSTALAETLATFSTSRHVVEKLEVG